MSELPVVPDMAPLFEPFRQGAVRLKNRMLMAPMTRCFSIGGVPGKDVAAYYRRRAEGGIGLIVTEGTWIPHRAASNEENAPRFYGDDALTGWSHVVSEVHQAGSCIVPQLWHTGLSRRPQADHIYADVVEDLTRRVGPSGYVSPQEKVGEEMSGDEIAAVIDAYAAGAETAQKLGFDGVEIHGAHGYIVDQFLWQGTNRRTDAWGGDIGRRSRFAAELVRACRGRTSPDFPIIFRFSQWKMQDFNAKLATTPQELEQVLRPLVEAGVDIFHASQRRFWEPEFPGSDMNLAGWAKRVTGKPTITVGSVGLALELFETNAGAKATAGVARIDRLVEMRARGDFDLVAVGRALLADHCWPDKVRRGATDELQEYDSAILATLA